MYKKAYIEIGLVKDVYFYSGNNKTSFGWRLIASNTLVVATGNFYHSKKTAENAVRRLLGGTYPIRYI